MLWFERPHYLGGRQLNPYYWYWHDYRCRLEPWTYEWRRHVARWWWVTLIKMGVAAGLCLWLLLWPLSNASNGVKVAIIVVGVVVVVFYAWLLLHLGHFASKLLQRIKSLYQRIPG